MRRYRKHPIKELVFTVVRGKFVEDHQQLTQLDVKNENTGVTSEERNQIKQCEVIHVGLVCSGFTSNLNLHTMLKSIYFYCKNPLHFHIFVDNISKKVLDTLFRSWAVPQGKASTCFKTSHPACLFAVNVSFYDITNHINNVRWVPNSHYSGVYGLMKLVFPNVVPDYIDKIIVLDTDLTFMGDISELWQLFEKFDSKQVCLF